MSLYRAYRPKTFADVVDQDHIVSTLERAAEQGRIAHAYLFAGPRGTGKTSVARILAKVILTKDLRDETLQKHVIAAVEDGSLVDLTEIDAASNRGIDDIRSLLEKINYHPSVSSAKVFIIDEVHMLTREAFNALLKTLEEPPSYAFFILATTEIHKVPPTIQSRCQRFLFRQIREEDIIRRLQFVADQERIVIERAALRNIAHAVQGSMRDALALLDQLRALPQVTAADVTQRIGETGHEFVEAMLAAMEAGNAAEVLALTKRMEEIAVPLETFTRLLLSEVRAAIHRSIEDGKTTAPLLKVLDALLRALRDMRIAPVPALILESTILALCAAPEEKERGKFSFFRRKKEKEETEEKETKETDASPISAVESAVGYAAPAMPASVEAPECTLAAIRAVWPDIVKHIEPPAVRMSLKNGEVYDFTGNILTLTFASAFHRDKVAEIVAARGIEEILARHFKRSLRLRCILETESGNAATPDTRVVNLAEAAAEVF